MTTRYSTFTLKIKALANLSTLSTFNDAEVWDVVGRQGMNAAERGSFRLYASNATLLAALESNVGQVVTVYVTDQVASGANMDLATFIIKNIDTETGEGVSEVTVSGPEITDQLRNKHARDNAIDNASGGPSTTDITTIMGYAPAGWTLPGATATAAGTYHAARGDTVLKLLNAAAQQSGEIFRLNEYVNPSSKGLFWTASPDSSGVMLQMPSTHSEFNGSTTVGKLYSLRRSFDFEPVITRIRPFGAGVGDGRLDITGIDSGDTGADPSWLDTDFANNWLINTDLETALGYEIEADIDFSWIQAQDPTNATQLTTAAVALWKTAKNFLEQNDSTRKFYTAVCNVAANLRPGQNITVVYSEYQGGMSGGSQTISDNAVFTILAVENRFEDGERITTLTLGDKPLPQPTAAQWVADVAEKTQDTTRKSDVGTSPGSVPSGRAINTNQPLTGGGDLSGDRTLGLGSLSSFGAANQLIGVQAVALDVEYKTLTPGTGIDISHAAGAITITNTSPGAAHDPVTLAADVGAILGLSGQQLTLDSQNANLVFAGPTGGAAADPTFRSLVDADIPASIARDSELHSPVTLATDANSILGLSGQQLTLDSQSANLVFAGPTSGGAADPTFRSLVDADIPASIARDSELHPAVSIAPSISSVFDIGAGQVLGMDNQSANTFLAGPSTGAATTPAFRALVDADIPASIARDSELHNQVHVLATTSGLGPDHTVSGLVAGQVLRASGATTAAFATLQHSDLGGVSANQHHNQSHVLATTSGLGPDHTVSGLTARQFLVATSATSAQFRAMQTADLPTQPSVRYRASSNQSIASGSFTQLVLGTEIWDTGTHWSGASAARLTVGSGEAGIWLIVGHTQWAGNSSGERVLAIELNGLTYLAMTENNPDGQTGALEQTVSTIWDASDGDYFRLMALQTSGGNLNANAATEYGTSFMMIRLSD